VTDNIDAELPELPPLPMVPPAPLPPPPPPPPVKFPLGWLLDHASGPIAYRALRDVAGLHDAADKAVWMSYAYAPAMQLAMAQSQEGTWNSAMLAAPTDVGGGVAGVGTINALRRLLEYGWDKDSPPMITSRRLLFRLLAEDSDPSFLFELTPKAKFDEDVAAHNRQILREASAATLSQAGYEADPRLRGVTKRILDRTLEFLESPLAEKPFIRVGNKQVLSPDAYPPSIYTLHLLSHLPLLRTEYHTAIEAIYKWISQPWPRQEAIQMVGDQLLPVPHLVLGDMLPHRNALDADVPAGVMWLEIIARMGFLRRNEMWSKMFERLLDDRGRDGVWHPHKGTDVPKTTNQYVWPTFPLDTPTDGDERWTDLTFRLGLIAKLSGRTIELL
jgi:hypothetical protein